MPLISTSLLSSACSANTFSHSFKPENIDTRFMNIDVHNSLLFKLKNKDFLPVTELSDLAWDEDQKLLYAISDEGYLYHFKISINDKNLDKIELVFSTQLKDKNKKPLKGRLIDSEGLAIRNGNNGKENDSELIISFENIPRVALYTPTGEYLKKVKTGNKLSKEKSYSHGNKGLESVMTHSQYGIITAPELPLKKKSQKKQTLYSINGKEWHFKPTGTKNSSITALETLPNGNILILERAYNGILSPIIISLRELKIDQCNKKELCKTELLAAFDSSEGWLVDNFEGLTHIRDNLYLMVSDNNKNPLQKTIFVLFEILDEQ